MRVGAARVAVLRTEGARPCQGRCSRTCPRRSVMITTMFSSTRHGQLKGLLG